MASSLDCRSIFVISILLAGYAVAQAELAAQNTEFNDGKKLELESRSEFLRIQALIRDKNGVAAANQIAALIDSAEHKLIKLPLEASNGSSRFVSLQKFANFVISSWHTEDPEALTHYRDLVDAESTAMLNNAVSESNVSGLQKVATKYFMSRVGDEATDRLAHILFEQGHYTLAGMHWDSLIRDNKFPASTTLKYPDSDLNQTDLMCWSLAASIFNREDLKVARKLEFLAKNDPNQNFDFLNKSGLDLAELRLLIQAEQASLDFEGAGQKKHRPEPVDLQGAASWTAVLEQQSKKRSPFFQLAPAVGEGMVNSISTFPRIENGAIFWRDSHSIFRKLLNENREPSGDPQEVIWKTPFLKETVESERKRIGRPVFDFEVKEKKLFARMGDPRTSYRNDTVTRNRSYLVGLDLEKGGKVLPGFPLENDDPRVEFGATPLYDQGYLYVVRRKTFRSNSVGQVSIQCLELSPSIRAERPKLIWRNDSISAESNNKGLWDEVSKTKLILVENKIAFVGLGFVAMFDKRSGAVEWISDYTRDQFVFPGQSGSQRRLAESVRAQDDGVFDSGKLYVAPADSSFLYCFEVATGKCLWRARTENTSHLLGVTDQHVLVSGHVLQWIDRQTGRLAARFPSGVSGTQVGYGLDLSRGIGKGTVAGQHLYWPTLNKVFVFETNLDRRLNPILKKVVDLKMRKASGGNLCVGKAIMLIASERTLWTFVE